MDLEDSGASLIKLECYDESTPEPPTILHPVTTDQDGASKGTSYASKVLMKVLWLHH